MVEPKAVKKWETADSQLFVWLWGHRPSAGAMRGMALPDGKAMAFGQGLRCGAQNYIAPRAINYWLTGICLQLSDQQCHRNDHLSNLTLLPNMQALGEGPRQRRRMDLTRRGRICKDESTMVKQTISLRYAV
jgi:hypothetical protein